MADNNDTRTDSGDLVWSDGIQSVPIAITDIWRTSTAIFVRTPSGEVFDLQPDEQYPALPEDAVQLTATPSRPPVAPEDGDFRTWLTEAITEARAERTGGEPEASAYKAGTVSAFITALAAYDRQARPPVVDNDQGHLGIGWAIRDFVDQYDGPGPSEIYLDALATYLDRGGWRKTEGA